MSEYRDEAGTKIYHMRHTPPPLSLAQKYVNGSVTILILSDGSQILMNEDGIGKKLPVNPLASTLAGQVILGNVLVLHGDARWKPNTP